MGQEKISKYLLEKNVKFTYCIKMSRVIPDLRPENEVTIEHLSVLQERFGQALEAAYPGQGISDIVTTHLSPVLMKEQLLRVFTEQAFLNLFRTEMGKGVLIGAFYQKYMEDEFEGEE